MLTVNVNILKGVCGLDVSDVGAAVSILAVQVLQPGTCDGVNNGPLSAEMYGNTP